MQQVESAANCTSQSAAQNQMLAVFTAVPIIDFRGRFPAAFNGLFITLLLLVFGRNRQGNTNYREQVIVTLHVSG